VKPHFISQITPPSLLRIKTKNIMNKLIIFLAVGVGFMLSAWTIIQVNQQRMVMGSTPEFIITGTSTMHDWEMKTNQARGQGNVVIVDQKITEVSDLSVTIQAKSLESSRSAMTSNALKALKADQHPTITYRLTEVTSSRAGGKGVILNTRGTINIAGVAKNITMPVEAFIQNGKAHFSGTAKVKMTDHNMEPPSFMMGTVRTGDEVSIQFNVHFNL